MASASKQMKPNGYTEKQTVKILTVDKDRRRVECATRDGAAIYAAVWDSPNIFRWPNTGEVWTVRKDSGVWRLDAQVRNAVAEGESLTSISDLQEGQTRILGTQVFFEGAIVIGNEVNTDNVPKGAALIWFDADTSKLRIKARNNANEIVTGSITLS